MLFAVRLIVVVFGVAALGAAYSVLRGVPEVIAVWPYDLGYGLSRVFIASMLAAIGAPVLWIGLSGDLAAIRPGAVNVIAVGVGLGAQAVWKIAFETPSNRLIVFAIAVWGLVVVAAVMLLLVRAVRWRDPRATPWLARGAFALFAFVLLVSGGLLVQRVQIFPWLLDRDAAIAYGVMFIGAAAYFVYGLVEPVWSNARGQLIGFLAYDAVLLLPYGALWPTAAGNQQLGLTVYLAVLVFSGAVAFWLLFCSPIWRFGRGAGEPVRAWRRRPAGDTGDAL